MVIVECPYCQARRYSWSEEDAKYKLEQHQCSATLTDKQIEDILMRIIDERG